MRECRVRLPRARAERRKAWPWTLDDLVADTRAVVGWTLGRAHRRIVIFGNGLGAMVGIRAARTDDRIGGLVASNCPVRTADFLLTPPPRRLLLRLAMAIPRALPLRISVDHFHLYARLIDDPEWVRWIATDPAIADARARSGATYASLVHGWDGDHEVRRLSDPLLLLQGARDALQPGEQTDILLSAPRGPKWRVTLASGHLPTIECPDLVAGAISDWIRDALDVRSDEPA